MGGKGAREMRVKFREGNVLTGRVGVLSGD